MSRAIEGGFHVDIFAREDAMAVSSLLKLLNLPPESIMVATQACEKHWIRTVGDLRIIWSEHLWSELESDLGSEISNILYNEMTKITQTISNVNNSLDQKKHLAPLIDEPRVFVYDHDFDCNGLIYNLGTGFGVHAWVNPMDLDRVQVTTSKLFTDSVEASCIVGREAVRCVTERDDQGYCKIDLKNNYINPTHYTLRHYSSWDTECLRCWNLEASSDGTSWVTLRKHVQDTSLRTAGSAHTWSLEPYWNNEINYYSKFRILLTGVNCNKHYYLALSGFEIYGDTITEKEFNMRIQRFMQEGTLRSPSSSFHMHCDYKSNFDENGILYSLATNNKTTKYENPAENNICTVTVSTPMHGGADVNSIVGRDLVRCGTGNLPYSWIRITFHEYAIRPDAYTLRHYISWDTECLRYWKLRASNDGENWVVLFEHINDDNLKLQGQAHTWKLPNTLVTEQSYKIFEIMQTDKNSNKHHHLCLSGFELYGDIYKLNNNNNMNNNNINNIVHLEYKHDFDENGLFYYIGTSGNKCPWQNPSNVLHKVIITSSGLSPDSQDSSSIVGRSSVRCVTTAKPGAFFMIYIKEYVVKPYSYTLRHYASWDTEALRYWSFEGSIDGNDWHMLKLHKDDCGLYKAGQSHTWNIDNDKEIFYQYFRVMMRGPNSNNHLFLALSGIEIYGDIKSSIEKNELKEKQSELNNNNNCISSVSEIDILSNDLLDMKLNNKLAWSPSHCTPCFEFSNYNQTAENSSTTNKWAFLRTSHVYSSGKHSISMKLVNDCQTTNSWRFIAGAVPINSELGDVTNRWIGKRGGWGYISGTGGICHLQGKSQAYGPRYTSNDIITILLDFPAKTISFKLNNKHLGIAYQDLNSPVHIAACCTAAKAKISLIDNEDDVKSNNNQNNNISSSSPSLNNNIDMKNLKWDPLHVSPSTAIMSDDVAYNTGSRNKWTAVRAYTPLNSQGKERFSIKILEAKSSPNTWKMIVGLVNDNFTCNRSKHWVGAYGGYGYIAGNGYLCHERADKTIKYGIPWGETGDIITVELDHDNHGGCISFIVNGISQGIAFRNVGNRPLYPAISLTATGSKVQILP